MSRPCNLLHGVNIDLKRPSVWVDQCFCLNTTADRPLAFAYCRIFYFVWLFICFSNSVSHIFIYWPARVKHSQCRVVKICESVGQAWTIPVLECNFPAEFGSIPNQTQLKECKELKGDLLCKINFFYMVFEQMYVATRQCVFTTTHYKGKNPPTHFVIFPMNHKLFLKMRRSWFLYSVTSQ